MYRPLTDSEIRQLEQQGCHAESWTRVRVAEGFRPEAVERVRFCGTVELGRFERPVEIEPGLFLPSGLSDAVLADCCVGDDCLVRHVGGYLRGYHLEEGATVMNCGTLTLDDEAEFGMDGALAGPDEGQPRCVAVCDRLAAPMAALMTSDSAAAAPMRRLAARRAVAWASTPRGVVGRGAVVVNTARVANTYIGDAGEVNGAALLSECALLSTTDIMPTMLALAGLGDRIPETAEGRNLAPLLMETGECDIPDAALYIRNLDGEKDKEGIVSGFFPAARGIKTDRYTMEIAINRDMELDRVLIFDDWNDPYQMDNISWKENPELFSGLCGILGRKLEEANDVWYREDILGHLMQRNEHKKHNTKKQ